MASSSLSIEQSTTTSKELQPYAPKGQVQQNPNANAGQQIQRYTAPTVPVLVQEVVPRSPQPDASMMGVKAQIHAQDFAAIQVEGEVGMDSAHLAVKKVEGKVEEKEVAVLKVEQGEDGMVNISMERWVQRTYMVVMQEMFVEVKRYNTEALAIEGPPVYQPSSFEKVADCCCQAYTCGSCTSLWKASSSKAVKKRLELTDSMRKARALGLKGMANAVSNLFTETPLGSLVRDTTVYGGFIITVCFFLNTLIGLIYDLVTDDDKSDDVLRISKLCISFVGLIFLSYDMFHHCCHYRCTTCKQMKEWKKTGRISSDSPELPKARQCQEKCTCCPEKCTTVIDIAHVLIIGIMFYPNLLLSIFQFSVQYIDHGNDATKVDVTTWLSTLFSFLQQLFNVYIARVFILAGTVWSIQKVRNTKKVGGAAFHVVFVLYAIGQMFLQVLMIVAIGARFHFEYKSSEDKNNMNGNNDTENDMDSNTGRDNYLPSGQLWYMIILAYFIPVIGMFMFFVVHHYWTQKFPIEVFRDLFEVLVKKPGMKETFMFWKKGEEFSGTMTEIMQYINGEHLEEDYEQYQKTNCENKILYPFTSPVHVILCFIYTGLLFSFILCFGIGFPSLAGNQSGVWIIFCVVATMYGALLNVYAFSVAGLYIMIFVGILLIIATVLVLCFLAVCLSSSNNNRRDY